jgi:hypothetical protein
MRKENSLDDQGAPPTFGWIFDNTKRCKSLTLGCCKHMHRPALSVGVHFFNHHELMIFHKNGNIIIKAHKPYFIIKAYKKSIESTANIIHSNFIKGKFSNSLVMR